MGPLRRLDAVLLDTLRHTVGLWLLVIILLLVLGVEDILLFGLGLLPDLCLGPLVLLLLVLARDAEVRLRQGHD